MSQSETKIPNPKYHSPLPFILQLRNLIFGQRNPGIYTKLTFFINLFAVVVFGVWNLITYFSIVFKDLFLHHKGVDVEAIISSRGVELGFDGATFYENIKVFSGVSLLVWGVILFSLVLLWRRSRMFIYFFLGGLIFELGMMFFFLGATFMLQDTTFFDKIMLLIMVVSSLAYFFLMKENEEDLGQRFFA